MKVTVFLITSVFTSLLVFFSCTNKSGIKEQTENQKAHEFLYWEYKAEKDCC